MASSSVGMQFGPMGTQIPIGQPQSQVNISDGQQQPQQPQPSYYSPARGDPAPLITPMMYSGSHRPGVMPSALPMSAAHFRYGSGAQLPVRSTTRTSSREHERASSRRETSPRIRASSRSISAGVPQAVPAGRLSAGDWHAALEEVQNALDTANRNLRLQAQQSAAMEARVKALEENCKQANAYSSQTRAYLTEACGNVQKNYVTTAKYEEEMVHTAEHIANITEAQNILEARLASVAEQLHIGISKIAQSIPAPEGDLPEPTAAPQSFNVATPVGATESAGQQQEDPFNTADAWAEAIASGASPLRPAAVTREDGARARAPSPVRVAPPTPTSWASTQQPMQQAAAPAHVASDGVVGLSHPPS